MHYTISPYIYLKYASDFKEFNGLLGGLFWSTQPPHMAGVGIKVLRWEHWGSEEFGDFPEVTWLSRQKNQDSNWYS